MSSKIRFENAGFYFPCLFVLGVLGFWPSYFARFVDGLPNSNFYINLHVIVVCFWISALIAQPLLIRKRKFKIHKLIGKGSYFLVPLIYISVLLLTHSRITIDDPGLAFGVFIPFKDLLIFSTAYFIAIKYRHDVAIHARAMIATCFVFIEPALIRLIVNVFDGPEHAYLWTVFLMYTLIITLIIRERNQQRGRWVFPLILVLYWVVHSVLIFEIQLGPWLVISRWFIGLPLT